MNIPDSKIAILVDNNFEQAEFDVPLQKLKAAGAQVTVVSTNTKELQALQHTAQGDIFKADELLESIDPEEYDALILPGGVVNADKLRMNADARAWVTRFIDQGKVVAAICHAPWLLVSADLVEGRRLTSYYTLQDDIRNAGGEWIDQPVVVDGNLITSRKPDDLEDFVEAIQEGIAKLETPASKE
jgi:protease I